jgi:hypothetical protein
MPTVCQAIEGIFPHSLLEALSRDCAVVFNCKSINAKEENYSTGTTYFIKANEKPRTYLEKMALEIFGHHTSTLSFNPSTSGAEWWTQVIDTRDDIGVHWDRDYDLEEEEGLHVYPYLGTVTYLSNVGAPTVVFAKEGTSNASESIIGPITELFLSSPVATNHIAFDGKMLHAAPLEFTEANESVVESGNESESTTSSETGDEASLEHLLANLGTMRITFLVNVWIDHIPSQARKCKKSIIRKMSLFPTGLHTKANLLDMTKHKKNVPTYVLSEAEGVKDRTIQLPFNNSDLNYKILLPFPSVSKVLDICRVAWPVRYIYPNASSVFSCRAEVVLDGDEEADSGEDKKINSNTGLPPTENDMADKRAISIIVAEEGGRKRAKK